MDWVLKILSGPSEGAQIDLEPGTYLIGRDDSCDLVLDDEQISDQHFKLTIEDNAVTLNVLADASLPACNGEQLDHHEFNLVSPSVLSLSDFHFVFALSDENLTDIEIPALVTNEYIETEDDTESILIGDQSEKLSQPSPSHVLTRLKSVGNKIALVFGMGIVVVTASAMMVSQEEPLAVIKEVPLSIQQLEHDLTQAGYPHVTLEQQASGVKVLGYIKDESVEQILKDLLPIDQDLDFQLTNLEQLKHAAEISLVAHQIQNVTVELGEQNGALTLLGFCQNEEKWQKVLSSLKADLSLVNSWEDKVSIQPVPDVPPLDVSSVSMGAVPFAVTRSGDRLFVGNGLGNGYRIEDIKLQYLLVSRGSEMVKVNLRF